MTSGSKGKLKKNKIREIEKTSLSQQILKTFTPGQLPAIFHKISLGTHFLFTESLVLQKKKKLPVVHCLSFI